MSELRDLRGGAEPHRANHQGRGVTGGSGSGGGGDPRNGDWRARAAPQRGGASAGRSGFLGDSRGQSGVGSSQGGWRSGGRGGVSSAPRDWAGARKNNLRDR
jgi:hypothetical protein